MVTPKPWTPVCYMPINQPYTPPPFQFCKQCRKGMGDFERDAEIPIGRGQDSSIISKKWHELKSSIEEGCPLCIAVSKCLESDRNGVMSEEGEKSSIGYQVTLHMEEENVYRLWLCCLDDNEEDEDRWEEPGWSSLEKVTVENMKYLNENPLGPSTLCAVENGLAKQWMDNCYKEHWTCHPNTEFIPTRVLDVGLESQEEIKLVLGSDLDPSTTYLTLSHCWGKHVPKRLLGSELQNMMESINISELTKTFQDAITVVRKVGQRYLWIDSLCIIQDDLSDWRKESGQMGKVFMHSYCNISATVALDGSAGLFYPRDSKSIEKALIRINSLSGDKSESRLFYDTHMWKEGVEATSLNSRGWVCQERFLSPNNLHFSHTQLFFECKEFTACEIFPRGFFPSDIDARSRSKQVLAREWSNLDTKTINHGGWKWHDLVGKYTSAKLTFRKDKLVAFSGLARLWGEALGEEEYLAGLWREFLVEELLWHVFSWKSGGLGEEDSNGGGEYVAPSWSWASVNDRVDRAWRGETIHKIEYVGHEIELVGMDPYGQIKGASLRLKGSLARFPGSKIFEDQSNEAKIGDVFQYWDRPKMVEIEDGTVLVESWEVEYEDELYLLPVLELEIGMIYLEGLILKPNDKELSSFRRVGKFNTGVEDSVKLILQGCRDFETSLEAAKLEGVDIEAGEKKYIIKLV